MKILHIVGSIDKSAGGPSRSVTLLCKSLVQSGIPSEIIARPSPDPMPVDSLSGFSVRFMSLWQLFWFIRHLSSKNVSLIHLQHIWDPYIHIVARAARRKGIPYLISPRGMLEPWIMNRHPLKKKMALWLYQRKDIQKAASLHATCEMEKENIQQLGFTNPVFIVPNGIELSQVQPKTDWRPVQHILFMSRVHPKKGIELLIEAMAKIQRPDIRVTIAGEGDAGYVESLKQLTREKQVERQFDFVGGVYGEAKWKLYQQADLFVLPTYSENFGIVVAEALATGLPVITTTGAPWEELEEYGCGWWIQLSVNQLAMAIKKALDIDANEIKQMGERGYKLIEEHYSIENVSKKMAELYSLIVSNNQRG